MMGTLPSADWAEVARWLGWLALATLLARPLAPRLLPGEGGGWIAAKLIGWLVVGWMPWLLAAFQILPFGAAAAGGIITLALAALHAGLQPIDWRGFLRLEAGFTLLFWLGLAVRLQNADLSGLEKFTDMGFLAAAMRADTMPPQDAWFAGHSINYYYVGQAMVAAWAHLAGVSAAHAYQLAMATLFALTALGAGLLTAGLVAPWGRRMQAVLGGTAGLLAVYGGNGHAVLYQLFRPWMPTSGDFYFPDSTRFIGFDPDMPDKAFTEFTAYAFAVGDLHAHLVATPLFLLASVLVLSLLRRGLAGILPGMAQAAAFGWMLGLAYAVNSWDVAILGLLALVVAAVLLARPSGLRFRQRADGLGAAAVVALGVAVLVAAPFQAGFAPFAHGLALVPARTPLWQLLVVWAHVLPALLLIAALALAGASVRALLPVAVVAVTGLLLVALPELVHMRDIYASDFARANTMFKLAFRAQTLLVAAGLAALAPAVMRGGAWLVAGLAAAAPLVATLAYLPHVHAPLSTIRSLDGMAFLGDERALVEAAATLPLARGEALIEAASEAFTGGARVSAMTGQPTVIGWLGHEWLWRGDAGAAMARAGDVDLFYTTTDPATRCRIVTRYGIRHVILGQQERARTPALDEAGLRALGVEIHASPGGSILRIPPDACPP